MNFKTFISLVCFGLYTCLQSQIKPTEVVVPDSIKIKCDNVFISEIGKKYFKSCIKFEKAYGFKKIFPNKQDRIDYHVDYRFAFPGVKESNVAFSFIYAVYSGKGHLQSAAFLRANKSDLPANIIKNGFKIMDYKKVLEIALKADTVLYNHKEKVSADFLFNQETFYWQFSYGYPNSIPNGDAEVFIEHVVTIDPYNGKVKSTQIR